MCKVIKNFIVNELKSIFKCTEEEIGKGGKIAFTYLGVYAVVMLITFLIALSNHMLSGVFTALFGIEVFILTTVVGIPIFLGTVYYAAYFARKGWERL